MAKKILIFSYPGAGHLNILKEFIKQFSSTYKIQLVITGWKNIPPDLDNLKTPPIILAKSTLKETDPALWTFPRVYELLNDCLQITKKFKPDLIIYDYFSLEGYFVGTLLKIPYWCSISALVGPFNNQKYLANRLSSSINKNAIQKIKQKYNLVINQDKIEMISDGLHIPGQLNLIWSYQSVTSKNFLLNRQKSKYVFVGNIRARKHPKQLKKNKPLVYLSFGTIVMNILWDQQKDTRIRLKKFISQLAKLWQHQPITIIFSSQGKKILAKYPANWQVFDKVDQIKVLPKTNISITHGGGNSFHESLVQQVPMIVIPFFGDQPLVAKKVEELKIGINLVKNDIIDTKKSKDFLNKNLANKLHAAVFQFLKNNRDQKNFTKINLAHTPIKTLLNQQVSLSKH